MTISDGLIEMGEAGMNSTSLVFVNMISSSFLIQPIMNKHVCNDNIYVHGDLYPTHACTQCLLILMHVHDCCRSLAGRFPVFSSLHLY